MRQSHRQFLYIIIGTHVIEGMKTPVFDISHLQGTYLQGGESLEKDSDQIEPFVEGKLCTRQVSRDAKR